MRTEVIQMKTFVKWIRRAGYLILYAIPLLLVCIMGGLLFLTTILFSFGKRIAMRLEACGGDCYT